jgi:hypothetical protein
MIEGGGVLQRTNGIYSNTPENELFLDQAKAGDDVSTV